MTIRAAVALFAAACLAVQLAMFGFFGTSWGVSNTGGDFHFLLSLGFYGGTLLLALLVASHLIYTPPRTWLRATYALGILVLGGILVPQMLSSLLLQNIMGRGYTGYHLKTLAMVWPFLMVLSPATGLARHRKSHDERGELATPTPAGTNRIIESLLLRLTPARHVVRVQLILGVTAVVAFIVQSATDAVLWNQGGEFRCNAVLEVGRAVHLVMVGLGMGAITTLLLLMTAKAAAMARNSWEWAVALRVILLATLGFAVLAVLYIRYVMTRADYLTSPPIGAPTLSLIVLAALVPALGLFRRRSPDAPAATGEH
jgi:hypothetical protein